MPSQEREKSGFGFSEDASEYRFLNGKTVWRDKPLDLSSDEIARGNAAVLALLRLGSPSVGYHDLALIGRAPLNYWSRAAFSFWFIGPTGTHKSANLAILESAFGDESGFENESGLDWEGSPSAIEHAQWERNGMLLGVDDFVSIDRAANAKVKRIIRLSGNVKGKGRVNWTKEGLTLVSAKPPRALLVSAGEIEPQVIESNAARMFINHVTPNDLPIQDSIDFYESGHAKNLHFAVMRCVKSLMNTQTRDTLRSRILFHQRNTFAGFRDRTARIAAELITGFETFLTDFMNAGAISAEELSHHLNVYQKLLMTQISERSIVDSESARLEKPFASLMDVISQASESDECYMRPKDKHTSVTLLKDTSRGDFIGWFEETGLNLLPQSILRVARRYQHPCGTWNTPALYRAADEEGFLIRTQNTKERSTVIKIGSTPKRVMRLRRDAIDNPYGLTGASDESEERASMPDDVRLAPSDNDDMQAALEASPGALQVLEVDTEWRPEINASDRHIRLAHEKDSPSEIFAFIRRVA